MNREGTHICILFLILLPLAGIGQDIAALPKLYPSNTTAYDLEQGMPISCAWDGLMDKKGRLWITPCFGQPEHQTVSFYQFDGRRSEEIHWDRLPEGARGQASLAGITDDGRLYGFFRKTNHFFFFDPDTRQTRFYQLGQEKATIIFMDYAPDHGLIVLAAYANRQFIYQLQQDVLKLLLDFKSPIDHDREPEKDRFFPNFQLLASDDLWFCAAHDFVFGSALQDSFRIMQFNLRSHTLEQYTFDDLFAVAPPPRSMFRHRVSLVKGPQGQVLLAAMDRVYQIDPKTKKAILRWVLPHTADHISYIFNYRIERDAAGNLLFLFPDASNHYTGVLMDTTGLLYDYSPVLKKTIDASPFPDLLHNNVWSRDFRRNILAFQQGGLIAADLQFYGSIATFLEDSPTRGIAEWKPGTYLVRPEDKEQLIIANPFKNSTAEPLNASVGLGHKLHPITHSSLLAKNGYWWYSSGNDLVRVDSNKVHTTMHIGSFFTKFTFLEKQVLALVTEKNQLCFFDLVTQKLSSAMENDRPVVIRGDVNELLPGKGNILWVATLQGLWKSDLKTGRTTQIGHRDGLRDERIMCMYEDKEGKLWLGTYTGGLQLYDPGTGSIQVIDRENGLSNNTVVGILRDDDGMLWVSTFNGINLISAQGEVLAHLDEKDGLSTNEFNRYSYFKDSQGRLLFGSVKGVNIIDPAAIKRQLGLSGELRIYLTSITRYDNQKGTDSTQYYGFEQLGTLHLPAAQRYLNLSFALSSFVRMEDQTFAYKIEQPDLPNSAEWVFLENNSQLYLPNLPPGTYNIFIRGSDHRGNHTPAPLVIRVHVAEFFYKTWWFYVLCSLPFLLGAYFWIRRLHTERERLEAEVAARTQQILHDKELIEKQAAALQELDELKSRFFTNISHEFRTPLTVISGMVTQIRRQPEQWLEKGMELIQRNSNQLLTLINQILDLRKLESGALKVHLVRSNIIPYLQYIAESFVQLAQARGLRIHVLANAETLEMDYDPEKMMHILSNLLSNAIKYTPAPGDIYLQIDGRKFEDKEQLFIQVRDTGQGIAPEALPYIFDQFYQVEDLATQKPHGSGIGLALTQELVKLLGGSIEVASTPGAGTTFSLTFPITRKAPAQESQPVPVVSAQVPPPSVLEKVPVVTSVADPAAIEPVLYPADETTGLPTLLIVEDNPDMRLYLTACLESHYQLFVAKDGQEGIDLGIEQVPDLIVSDVMMPVKDGFALCDTLKNDERTSHIPIVLLTAKADFESKLSGLRRGADAYLTKPFEQEELLVRLEQLLTLRKKLQERYRNPAFIEQEPDSEEVKTEDAFILKLRQLVLEHLGEEDYDIAHLCRALGVGRTQLHNKIKALTGRSTSEFVRTVRLNKARELLQTTDFNVSEVSYEVGISNPAYFSRIYAEEFGEAPRETRR